MLFPKRQLGLRQAHHTLSRSHCMAWCLSAPSLNLFSKMRVITVLQGFGRIHRGNGYFATLLFSKHAQKPPTKSPGYRFQGGAPHLPFSILCWLRQCPFCMEAQLPSLLGAIHMAHSFPALRERPGLGGQSVKTRHELWIHTDRFESRHDQAHWASRSLSIQRRKNIPALRRGLS